MIALDYFL